MKGKNKEMKQRKEEELERKKKDRRVGFVWEVGRKCEASQENVKKAKLMDNVEDELKDKVTVSEEVGSNSDFGSSPDLGLRKGVVRLEGASALTSKDCEWDKSCLSSRDSSSADSSVVVGEECGDSTTNDPSRKTEMEMELVEETLVVHTHKAGGEVVFAGTLSDCCTLLMMRAVVMEVMEDGSAVVGVGVGVDADADDVGVKLLLTTVEVGDEARRGQKELSG